MTANLVPTTVSYASMRKYLIIPILFLMTLHSQAQGIHFESGFLKQVFEKAKAENKPVFVDVFATWCAPCRYLDEVVFEDPEVGEYVNKHFISTQLDAEAGEGIGFAKEYMVGAYPTLMVFSPEGELLGRQEGVLEGPALKQWLAIKSTPNMPTSKRIKKSDRPKAQD